MAGIDGTVSTTIGAALAHRGRTIALIGDLTFVHDASGLLIGPTEPTPQHLTIVVSNDSGGGIFELLEQGDPQFAEVSSRIFGTPHDIDVGGLCRAYHVDYRQAEAEHLAAVLDEPFAGMRVVEVKADRSSLRRLHASIKAALWCRSARYRPASGNPEQVVAGLIHLTSDGGGPRRCRANDRSVDRPAGARHGDDGLGGCCWSPGLAQRPGHRSPDMGVAAAEVLSAGPRRSDHRVRHPDRVTYRPELGVLYPLRRWNHRACASTSSTTANPDLVRVRAELPGWRSSPRCRWPWSAGWWPRGAVRTQSGGEGWTWRRASGR